MNSSVGDTHVDICVFFFKYISFFKKKTCKGNRTRFRPLIVKKNGEFFHLWVQWVQCWSTAAFLIKKWMQPLERHDTDYASLIEFYIINEIEMKVCYRLLACLSILEMVLFLSLFGSRWWRFIIELLLLLPYTLKRTIHHHMLQSALLDCLFCARSSLSIR